MTSQVPKETRRSERPLEAAAPHQSPQSVDRGALKRHWLKVDHFLKLGTDDGARMAEHLVRRGPSPAEALLTTLTPRPKIARASEADAKKFRSVMEEARQKVRLELEPLRDIAYESVFSTDEFR